MFTVVRKRDASTRQIASNKFARNYITKDISPNASLAVIEANNYNHEEIATSNWTYYVLEGKLILTFDRETIELAADDSCLVNKGTSYRMMGTFRTVIVSQPAFGISSD